MRMSDWLTAQTTARVGGGWFHTVETPAATVIKRMEDEPVFANRVRFAFIALTDDPGCIEAHLFLAEHTGDEHRARAHLEKAVETGRQLWEPLQPGKMISPTGASPPPGPSCAR